MLTRNALPVYLWLYRNYWIYRLPFRSSWFISTLITLMMRSLGALRPTPLLASSSPSASSSLSLFPSIQVGRSPSSRQFPLYLYPNSAGGQANRKWAFRSRSIVTITDDCWNDDAVFVATREHGVKSGPANEPSNLNPLSSIGSPSLLNHVSICRHFYRTRDVCVCVCVCAIVERSVGVIANCESCMVLRWENGECSCDDCDSWDWGERDVRRIEWVVERIIFDIRCFLFSFSNRIIFCAVLFWMEYLGIFIIHFIKMEIFWNFLEDFFKIVQDPSCFS